MRALVLGGGPAGATAGYWLAAHGIEVTVLEKTAFPREKVCGDGLTPRAVREMRLMGLPHGPELGYARNRGLRLVARERSVEVPWPELSDFPPYGLVRTRLGFDEHLAGHARAAGARVLERRAVTGVLRDGSGRVVGARANVLDAAGRRTGETEEHRADVVLAADGNSSRTAVSAGLHKRDDRPMGVAVRAYFESPRSDLDWMEGWLELTDGTDPQRALLPGYGWVFGVGDGTANVGLGILDTSPAFGALDYRKVLADWTASMPAEWTFDEEHRRGRVLGAALPMAFNRTPHDVTLRWAEDCLRNWREAGFGWALWNFRGPFGILDSGRADVRYDEFHGHQLDRKLLDLLRLAPETFDDMNPLHVLDQRENQVVAEFTGPAVFGLHAP